jgi:two-component system, sensor histidine kinase and response regulator
VRGRLESYLRVLALFAHSHANDVAELWQYLDNGARPAAQQLVHTMKGAAATLGAEAVRERALALELALRTQAPADAIEACIVALDGTLTPLLMTLSRITTTAAPAASGHIAFSRFK